jgi:hypothetical protein
VDIFFMATIKAEKQTTTQTARRMAGMWGKKKPWY